jgi:hypothetical protein
MIIFKPILTFFKSSVVFRGNWGSCENWLEPKIDPPAANLASPNPSVKHSVLGAEISLVSSCLPAFRRKSLDVLPPIIFLNNSSDERTEKVIKFAER